MSEKLSAPVCADDEVLLTGKQVAALLNLSAAYVTEHSLRGVEPVLPFIRMACNRVRYQRGAVRKFVADLAARTRKECAANAKS